MNLIGDKMTRRELEKQLGLRGKEATQAIRELRERQCLMCDLDPIGAQSAKRERRYFFVARTVDMFRSVA